MKSLKIGKLRIRKHYELKKKHMKETRKNMKISEKLMKLASKNGKCVKEPKCFLKKLEKIPSNSSMRSCKMEVCCKISV